MISRFHYSLIDTNFERLESETEKKNELLLHRLLNETGKRLRRIQIVSSCGANAVSDFHLTLKFTLTETSSEFF